MKLIKGLPIYNVIMNDEELGILRISLVDRPAVDSLFLAYDENKEEVKYSVQDTEERVVLGVLLRADYPIFRANKEIGNHYHLYSKEIIKQISEKLLLDENQNKVNLMHQAGSDVSGVNMFQLFIKDSVNGINPAGFEDIEDGSLFAAFKVENDEIWEEIKNGIFKGFSIEGLFSFELVQDDEDKEINEIMDLIEKILK